MSRPAKHDSASVELALKIAASTGVADELRRAQAVLLPALIGATLEQTATILGVSPATVSRYRQGFDKLTCEGEPTPSTWGGRRNCWMSWEEECAFLDPWIKQATEGSLVVAAPLREALAKHIGQPVRASVIYRMLERHGWRKVAPDTRHPKGDPVAQEEWKKNSRKRWVPL
jgi:transposase